MSAGGLSRGARKGMERVSEGATAKKNILSLADGILSCFLIDTLVLSMAILPLERILFINKRQR